MKDIKKRIIEAAKTLASTPESDASGTPEVIRYKVHALIEACEELIRHKCEVIQWYNPLHELPPNDENRLASSPGGTFIAYYDDESEVWRFADTGGEAKNVSLWAEIPEGPSE